MRLDKGSNLAFVTLELVGKIATLLARDPLPHASANALSMSMGRLMAPSVGSRPQTRSKRVPATALAAVRCSRMGAAPC